LPPPHKLLGEMLPQLADWQAAGKVAGVAVDGDQPETLELGGYKITAALARGRREGFWALNDYYHGLLGASVEGARSRRGIETTR
jgi:hypothetical protein